MSEYKTVDHSRTVQMNGTDRFNRIVQIVLNNLRHRQPRIIRKLQRTHLIIQQADLPDVEHYAIASKFGPNQYVYIDFDRIFTHAGNNFDGTDVMIGVLIDQLVRIILGQKASKSLSELNATVDDFAIKLGFVHELAELRSLESYRLRRDQSE